MAKYSKKLVDKFVLLIEEDNHSIASICRILKVGTSTFYRWKDENKEFAQEIKRAEERRSDRLMNTARKGLRKKLEGYTIRETKTKYIPNEDGTDLKIKEYIVKEKHHAPDNHCIKWALTSEERILDNQRNGYVPFLIQVQDEHTKKEIELLESRARSGK